MNSGAQPEEELRQLRRMVIFLRFVIEELIMGYPNAAEVLQAAAARAQRRIEQGETGSVEEVWEELRRIHAELIGMDPDQ